MTVVKKVVPIVVGFDVEPSMDLLQLSSMTSTLDGLSDIKLEGIEDGIGDND